MTPRYVKKHPSTKRGPAPRVVAKRPEWIDLDWHKRLSVRDWRKWVRLLAQREAEVAPSIGDNLRPVYDPVEVDRFLERPSSTVELWDTSRPKHSLVEAAAHAVKVGFAVFAFDPSLPNDDARAKFNTFLTRVRSDCPISLGRATRGKPPVAPSFRDEHLRRWCDHRILLLFDLLLRGHNPTNERKTLAAWMFPEIRDQVRRGKKFDEARRFLDEARNCNRVLWAQARGDKTHS